MRLIALTLLLGSLVSLPVCAEETNPNAPVRVSNDIQAVFNKSKDEVFKAISERRKEKPGLNGTVVYEVTVEPDGAVNDSTKVLKSTLNDEKLEASLLKIIKKLEFGKANHPKQVTFQFPIELPKEDATKSNDKGKDGAKGKDKV